jgi:hypothetical protein
MGGKEVLEKKRPGKLLSGIIIKAGPQNRGNDK